MNGSELRDHAFDEMHHRLRQVRSYSLLDRDGSKTTVHAALIAGDELTESNPFNQKTLSLAGDALLPRSEDILFPWIDAMDGKQTLLTLAQVRSLAEGLTAFQKVMYDFLDKVWAEIDAGVITTFEQVDHSSWPT
jgi:hypothetical protein